MLKINLICGDGLTNLRDAAAMPAKTAQAPETTTKFGATPS
jgi:hypothetical protein